MDLFCAGLLFFRLCHSGGTIQKPTQGVDDGRNGEMAIIAVIWKETQVRTKAGLARSRQNCFFEASESSISLGLKTAPQRQQPWKQELIWGYQIWKHRFGTRSWVVQFSSLVSGELFRQHSWTMDGALNFVLEGKTIPRVQEKTSLPTLKAFLSTSKESEDPFETGVS